MTMAKVGATTDKAFDMLAEAERDSYGFLIGVLFLCGLVVMVWRT